MLFFSLKSRLLKFDLDTSIYCGNVDAFFFSKVLSEKTARIKTYLYITFCFFFHLKKKKWLFPYLLKNWGEVQTEQGR